MQKATTHLNNSNDKNKEKEIKTTPVPVENPKKAEKLREADKKLMKKIIESTGLFVVGLLLSCIWLSDVNWGSIAGAMYTGVPAHTPPLHQDQGLNTLPTTDFGTDKGEPSRPIKSFKGKDEIIRSETSRSFADKNIVSEIEQEKYGIVFSDHQYALDFNSPIYNLVEMVNKKWKTPMNLDLLALNKIENVQNNSNHGFYLDGTQTEQYQHLILITFELKEFTESSSKALYSLTPQNKAQIKLVLRGVDARSQTMLFEQEIAHETKIMDWANYQPIATDTILHTNKNYAHSEAMHQALELTSKDIISILNKYFP